MPPGKIARKLVGHTAAARAALQRPHQRLWPGRVDGRGSHAKGTQPLRHDGQVFVLAEGVEADPQAKPLGLKE